MALKQGDKIGILGGGQLAQLLINAANKLGLKTLVFDPNEDSPAFNIATEFICEAFSNQKALEIFSKKSDIVTYEFENIPFNVLKKIDEEKTVLPKPDVNNLIQNRLTEKDFLNKINIQTTKYKSIDKIDNIHIKEIVTRCLSFNPKERYTIKELLNVDFFRNRQDNKEIIKNKLESEILSEENHIQKIINDLIDNVFKNSRKGNLLDTLVKENLDNLIKKI